MLTVAVLRSLQLMLVCSLVVQLQRVIFICYSTDFSGAVLRNNYWIFYTYQVTSTLTIFVVDLCFVTQIAEWSLVIFIINY